MSERISTPRRRFSMVRTARPATLIVICTALLAGGLAAAQESKPAAPAQSEPGAPQATAKESPREAVDRLVEQLRRYPARPSSATAQLGLFLIDAGGGEATLIANEPEPW